MAGAPSGQATEPGPLAQLVEQGTLNPKVEGSNPSRPTRIAAGLRPVARLTGETRFPPLAPFFARGSSASVPRPRGRARPAERASRGRRRHVPGSEPEKLLTSAATWVQQLTLARNGCDWDGPATQDGSATDTSKPVAVRREPRSRVGIVGIDMGHILAVSKHMSYRVPAVFTEIRRHVLAGLAEHPFRCVVAESDSSRRRCGLAVDEVVDCVSSLEHRIEHPPPEGHEAKIWAARANALPIQSQGEPGALICRQLDPCRRRCDHVAAEVVDIP